MESSIMSGKRAYGDWQTPTWLAAKICEHLKNGLGLQPSAVLEPTCGIGNLLKESLSLGAKEYCGIEINPDYCKACKEKMEDERTKIINSDFFATPTANLIRNKEKVLLLGNPPWANSSTLSGLNARNLPAKENFKRMKGIEAMTGNEDFDICECVILKLAREWRGTNAAIAMLCKTSTARKLLALTPAPAFWS